MQTLLELAPLAAFFIAYKMAGLYTATAVLMGAMAAVLAVDYLRYRRVPVMHGLSALLVFAFGAATLGLHDKRFIQWKPTVFFWLVSLAFLGSTWIGRQPLVERLLSKALEGHIQLPRARWLRINWLWVVFYAILGAVNLFVAQHASESTWVNCKIALMAATFFFVVTQFAWIMRQAPPATSSGQT